MNKSLIAIIGLVFGIVYPTTKAAMRYFTTIVILYVVATQTDISVSELRFIAICGMLWIFLGIIKDLFLEDVTKQFREERK